MGRSRYRFADDEEENTSGYKFQWFGNNRLICDVLEDMRRVVSVDLGPSILKGLIEEAQVMANRMESALSDQRDLIKLNQEVSKARRAYNKLEREFRELEAKIKPLRDAPKKKS